MERLFRDRMAYVTSVRSDGCFICEAVPEGDDASHGVLARTGDCIVIVNKFPYNSGHLVVAPVRHVSDLDSLSAGERAAVIESVNECIEVLRAEIQPHGFNIGANLGEVSGAGLPGHFHMHVVPRWEGDTNFMPVTAATKVLSETPEATYQKLRSRFS